MVSPLTPRGPYGRFAERLLADELPGLPPDRLAAAVAFTCRRASQTPSPLRLGVTGLSLGLAAVQRLVGVPRATDLVRGSRLPLVGELPRMVRSLAFAYIWETWPNTQPDGSPAGVTP
jgi:hypothetical protein